jgi:WD40 repeat protein/energy-coupling factor transporter ATP-binding protein EcfA2
VNQTVANPFVGLRPFESRDSLYYFGRGEQTKALLRQLHQTRFLAVVGSSGSGKSSLIRAGLIPNLEAGFLVQDRDLWKIATMKPGDSPLHNMAMALVKGIGGDHSTGSIDTLLEMMRAQGALGVIDQIQGSLARAEANLLLLVDQFEELFREGRSQEPDAREEAAEFVGIMLRLAEQNVVPVHVCLTMRSDFLGDCDRFAGLPEAMNRSQYLVPRLTRNQRREAIVGPVRLSGAAIAPRLVDRLLNEKMGTRDDLPILQHALMRTWVEWSKDGSGPIDDSHYEAVGTIREALSRHADEALNELDEADRELAKRIFQTITETDAGNRQVRRQTHLDEVARSCGCVDQPERITEVIKKFRGNNRNFIVSSSEKAEENPLIDISHESLIRQWPALSDWVADEAESAGIYRRLADTAQLHANEKASLYRGADLEVALQWREKENPTPEWADRYHLDFSDSIQFLDDSFNAKTSEVEEKKRKQTRTAALASATILFLFVIAIAASYFALQARDQKRRAEVLQDMAFDEKYKAIKQALISKSKQLEANYNLAKVFEEKALNALDDTKNKSDIDLFKKTFLFASEALLQEIPAGRNALNWSSIGILLDPNVIRKAFACRWFSPIAEGKSSAVWSVAFSPDGKKLVSGSENGTIRLWDVESGALVYVYTGHMGRIAGVAFSPDGKIIASASGDRTVRLWDTVSGNLVEEFTGHNDRVSDVAFSPDGKVLASASEDSTIRLWELASRQLSMSINGHEQKVFSVIFSPDGKTFATGSMDNTAKLWETSSGKLLAVCKGHKESVRGISFSPDGKTLATAGGTINLWNASTGELIDTFKGHNRARSVKFSPDGNTLASASWDKTTRLWDMISGKTIQVFEGHTKGFTSVDFSPDGKMLATASHDGTVKLWDKYLEPSDKVFRDHVNNDSMVAFSPDGKTFASDRYGSIKIWDASTGKPITRLEGHYGSVPSVTFSPDGKTLASAGYDNTVKLWDTSSGKINKVLNGHTNGVLSVTYSPDGDILASGSYDRTVRLWHAATGEPGAIIKGHRDRVSSVAFSPDGKTLATASYDNTIRLWNGKSGQLEKLLEGHEGYVYCVAFSPNGKNLASSSYDKTIRVWEVTSGKQIFTIKGHSQRIESIAFSPDGKILASASGDSTIKLWDAASGQQIRVLEGQRGGYFSVTFSPDGKTLASASEDNTVRLWDVSTYNLFLSSNKPTPLFHAFSSAARFLWQVERDGLEFKRYVTPALKPKDGYYFVHDKRFRPLLDPPPAGQTKYDQVLTWAQRQVAEEKKSARTDN